MARPMSGPQPLFPAPLPGQSMLFPATSCRNHQCDQGALRAVSHSHCSCESISGAAGYSRLLPLVSTDQLMNTKVPTNNLGEPWLHFPTQTSRSNYESLLINSFPLYGKFGNESYPSIDYALLANARRKNATRETTTTLKAWLNEHKKNPYPTKGEKVMLAILTKMTLTQVSTWFANARRRLKKENKMTWQPRKKTGDKKNSDKDDDNESYMSSSDIDEEGIDVDVDGVQGCTKDDKNSITEKTVNSSEVAAVNSDRPSVIRTLESPTFNEIRDRFGIEPSPVNDLQKWVNGCFQGTKTSEDINDFPHELTPPSTPIESKVTTFTSQKLFEAFDAAKLNKAKETTPPPSITDISPFVIFSSKQPVLSTRVTISTSPVPSLRMGLSSVMTPQPSPKNDTEFFNVKSKEYPPSPVMEIEPQCISSPVTISSEPAVRVQGLTTSRELEAVLALTNLCKS